MEELQTIFTEISGELTKANDVREKILSLSRSSVQKSSHAIKHLHRGDFQVAEKLISENKALIIEINELSNQMDQIRFGMILTCNQEYAEAVFLHSFLTQNPYFLPFSFELSQLTKTRTMAASLPLWFSLLCSSMSH